MLKQISPRLRRSNVMLNGFSSCISNAPEEFTWTPEVSFSEIASQPRMFLHQFESTVTFEQLQGFADRHCWRQFNKQMDMVNSDMQLIDFTSVLNSNFSNEPFTINFQPIKPERVHCIFNFPDKMESILSKAMFKFLQIHVQSPKIAHAKFVFNSGGLESSPSDSNHLIELNIEDGNSSLCLKAQVSLPLM